jgi:hypothetical protein
VAENSIGPSYSDPMIQRYLDNIEKVIGSHPAILSSTLQKQIGPDSKTIYLKGLITFVDLSVLELSIFAISFSNRVVPDKYRFQYMDKKSHIVFRYDNAPHHRELSTFPHHKHLIDKVVPSEMPALADILDEISTFMLRK